MKTLKIKRIEAQDDTYSVEFDTTEEIEEKEFDLEQLGSEITYLSSFRDMIMVVGKVTLKAGDSITDDFGGEPIIGENRKEAEEVDFSIRPTVDYRDAFQAKRHV